MIIHEHHWLPGPGALQLIGAEIHLWRAVLDQPAQIISEMRPLLSPDEQHKAQRFRRARDQQRYITGRALLRLILSRYLDMSPDRIAFVYGPHGKPMLADCGANSSLRFNLAHAEHLAIYAIARHQELGVDLEYMNPQIDVARLARRGLSPRELVLAQTLPMAQQTEYFYRCWTRKEAFVKASGTGLSGPLDRLEIPPALHAPVTFSDPTQPASGPWTILEYTPASQFVAALVASGTACDLACWTWA